MALTTVPVTLSALRTACGEPTMSLEACPICSRIPAHCSRFEKGGDVQHDDIPPEVSRLEGWIGAIPHRRGEIQRCPTCHRLYWYESEYEFIYGGSEDTYTYRRLSVDQLFHDEWFVELRVGGADLARAIRAALPDLPDQPPKLGRIARQEFFTRHDVVEVEVGDEAVWVALADEGQSVLTGDLDALARIAAVAPPKGLDQPARAAAYAELADEITSPDRYGFLRVVSFADIPWRAQLTDEERAYIEDLRRASAVKPPQVERVAGGVAVRCWVVAHRKLICRVLTVSPSGALQREDAVIGEMIPTHLGKRWEWSHARKRPEPCE